MTIKAIDKPAKSDRSAVARPAADSNILPHATSGLRRQGQVTLGIGNSAHVASCAPPTR